MATFTALLLLLCPPCIVCLSTKTGDVYPLSTRKALIEKAKSLPGSSYSTVGWSNRVGAALTPAALPGVYTADRPFLWNNIDVGCRMTVVELSSGELWVHSPVALDGPLREALAQLGTVRHVVSPNYEHVKFAKQWSTAFPEASMWACPGLMERMPEINWAGELPYGCRPPTWPDENDNSNNAPLDNCWDWNEIQPLHNDCEVNPFTGKPFFNEVIFYHTKSKTLLTTDLYWNYPRDGVTNSNYASISASEQDFGVWELAPEVDTVPLGSRLWKQGMDKVFRPFYMNLMIRQDTRPRFNAIAEFIVHDGAWEIETVIPAHGDILRGKTFIQNIFQDFFKLEKTD